MLSIGVPEFLSGNSVQFRNLLKITLNATRSLFMWTCYVPWTLSECDVCVCWMEVLNWLLNVGVLFSYPRGQKHFSPIKYRNPWQALCILEIRFLEMCRPTVFQNVLFSNFANCVGLNKYLFQVHIRYCMCNHNKLPLERYLTTLPIDKIFFW